MTESKTRVAKKGTPERKASRRRRNTKQKGNIKATPKQMVQQLGEPELNHQIFGDLCSIINTHLVDPKHKLNAHFLRKLEEPHEGKPINKNSNNSTALNNAHSFRLQGTRAFFSASKSSDANAAAHPSRDTCPCKSSKTAGGMFVNSKRTAVAFAPTIWLDLVDSAFHSFTTAFGSGPHC